MEHFINSFTMDVLCACAFGINPDSVNNPGHLFVLNLKSLMNTNVNLGRVLCILAPKVARLFNIELFDPTLIDFFVKQSEMVLEQAKIDRGSINNQYKASL